MSLITIILVLAIVGFLAWLVLQIPMPAIIRNLILGIVAICVVLWILQQFGVATGFPVIRLK